MAGPDVEVTSRVPPDTRDHLLSLAAQAAGVDVHWVSASSASRAVLYLVSEEDEDLVEVTSLPVFFVGYGPDVISRCIAWDRPQAGPRPLGRGNMTPEEVADGIAEWILRWWRPEDEAQLQYVWLQQAEVLYGASEQLVEEMRSALDRKELKLELAEERIRQLEHQVAMLRIELYEAKGKTKRRVVWAAAAAIFSLVHPIASGVAEGVSSELVQSARGVEAQAQVTGQHCDPSLHFYFIDPDVELETVEPDVFGEEDPNGDVAPQHRPPSLGGTAAEIRSDQPDAGS